MPARVDADAAPCLRADAERNRGRLLAAARDVFAEQGLDAPMSEVARRAGVGIATLFRRFPTREHLITATFAEAMAEYADAIDAALDDPDPWRGFCGYVESVFAMQAADHGFAPVLTMTFPHTKPFEVQRDRAFAGFTLLIARAKEAGGLRADFVAEDLVMALMANAGVIAATGSEAPDTWRRLTAYFLQAFAADATPTPLPDPSTPRQMLRAMRQLGQPRSR